MDNETNVCIRCLAQSYSQQFKTPTQPPTAVGTECMHTGSFLHHPKRMYAPQQNPLLTKRHILPAQFEQHARTGQREKRTEHPSQPFIRHIERSRAANRSALRNIETQDKTRHEQHQHTRETHSLEGGSGGYQSRAEHKRRHKASALLSADGAYTHQPDWAPQATADSSPPPRAVSSA